MRKTKLNERILKSALCIRYADGVLIFPDPSRFVKVWNFINSDYWNISISHEEAKDCFNFLGI